MLKGHIAFITGAGSGIGRSTCQLFAEEGAAVVAVDINEQNISETIGTLKGQGHLCLRVDIRYKKEIEDAIEKVKEKYQNPPSIAVNCAGIHWLGSLLDITDEGFQRVMDVNVKGLISVTQLVCKELIASGKSGSIVNIASVSAHICDSRVSLYSMSKAAVEAFTKSAAKEMAKHNIRVNTVLPSATKTAMLEAAPPEYVQSFPPQILAHLADPKEVAQVILFLASDRASYVSGSSYSVTAALL